MLKNFLTEQNNSEAIENFSILMANSKNNPTLFKDVAAIIGQNQWEFFWIQAEQLINDSLL